MSENQEQVAAETKTADEIAAENSKWLTTLILSVVLGSLGADRFYSGQTGLGILKF